MKIRIPLLILPIIATSCALIPQPVTDESGRPVRACPYGHATLRKTPISYGMPVHNAKLERSIDECDVILGGCVIEPHSPKKALVCTTCKFVYNPPSGEWDKGYWSRRSTDITSFKEGFPAILTSVPLPKEAHLIGYPVYTQFVRNGKTTSSAVKYATREPFPVVKKEIVEFLGNNHLKGEYGEDINSTKEKRWRDIYSWRSINPFFGITVFHEADDTCVITITASQNQKSEPRQAD